jgi:hypothetical protein
MKLTSLMPVQNVTLTSSSTHNPADRGSGRVWLALATALLLLLPLPAIAGNRDEFPDARCPGSSCPDNAKP